MVGPRQPTERLKQTWKLLEQENTLALLVPLATMATLVARLDCVAQKRKSKLTWGYLCNRHICKSRKRCVVRTQQIVLCCSLQGSNRNRNRGWKWSRCGYGGGAGGGQRNRDRGWWGGGSHSDTCDGEALHRQLQTCRIKPLQILEGRHDPGSWAWRFCEETSCNGHKNQS